MPCDLTVLGDGTLAVCDSGNSRVVFLRFEGDSLLRTDEVALGTPPCGIVNCAQDPTCLFVLTYGAEPVLL